MNTRDFLRLVGGSIRSHRIRSGLTALGIAIGIAAVVLLTSIGEGIQRFVLAEFTQFGTNLVAINPGRVMTHGGPLGIYGTTRPLGIEDADALRRLPYVESVVAVTWGNAAVEAGRLSRRTTVYGVGSEWPRAFSFTLASGEFLPPDDPRTPRAFAVLGSILRDELFRNRNPLGERIRVGGERYRVVGVMEPKGQVLGFSLDDTVYIPVARALELFNREGVMEIDVLYADNAPVDEVVATIKRTLTARHKQEDFTLTTQEQMLDVLGNILGVVTFAVGTLGGISLFVGGVGILTIMTIAVKERTAEIGLFRALGARNSQIQGLFLAEAIILAAAGGLAGLVVGVGGAWLLHALVPALPVHTSWYYVVLAELLAVLIGVGAGVMPARRAAALTPVEALRSE
jgi:putative ABC transport system permease protein